MKWNETEKKQLWIYLLVAFGVPYLMGILIGISHAKGNDVTAFGNVQMFYPAAGVMLALLLTAGREKKLPKKFYISFLITTVLLMLTAVASMLSPEKDWMILSQHPLMLGSVVCGILLLTEKKGLREEFGLRFGSRKKGLSWLMVLLFFGLYLLRLLISALLEGETASVFSVFASPMTYIMMVSLVFSFFLSFTAFFGEEYGWRYFFQPLLQKRFGMRGGVLILGVLWGLWHLPLNLFYYSPDTWYISIILQIITCISLAIFFAYAYQKTGNIWVPVIMHYLNNNMIAVLTGTADLSGQVYNWAMIGESLVMNLVFFVFIFSKEFGKKKNAEETTRDADEAVEDVDEAVKDADLH